MTACNLSGSKTRERCAPGVVRFCSFVLLTMLMGLAAGGAGAVLPEESEVEAGIAGGPLVPVERPPEDDDEDIETLGGLVFSLAGRVPTRGELIVHPSGLQFEIIDADPRRIKRLRIQQVPPATSPIPSPPE